MLNGKSVHLGLNPFVKEAFKSQLSTIIVNKHMVLYLKPKIDFIWSFAEKFQWYQCLSVIWTKNKTYSLPAVSDITMETREPHYTFDLPSVLFGWYVLRKCLAATSMRNLGHFLKHLSAHNETCEKIILHLILIKLFNWATILHISQHRYFSYNTTYFYDEFIKPEEMSTDHNYRGICED